MQMYLDAGADPNKKSGTGNTALHYCFDQLAKLPTFAEARKREFQKCTWLDAGVRRAPCIIAPAHCTAYGH